MLAILSKFILFLLIAINSLSLDIFIKKYCIEKSKIYSKDLISILGTINISEQVNIIGEKDNYYKIKWKKSEGYIMKRSLVDKIIDKVIGEVILSVDAEAFADMNLEYYLGKLNKSEKIFVLEIIDMKNYKIFKAKHCYIKIKKGEYIFKEIK